MNIVITKSKQIDTEDIYRVGNLVESGYSLVYLIVEDLGQSFKCICLDKKYIHSGSKNEIYTKADCGFVQFHGKVELSIE
jgi:hypothetical protein